MKKIIVKMMVAVLLIGGFAIIPHSTQPTKAVADPGGVVVPPGSVVLPTDPTA